MRGAVPEGCRRGLLGRMRRGECLEIPSGPTSEWPFPVRPGPFHVVFFLSGFTSLLFELVFYKLLGYAFGSSAVAVTTVLVAFMGGLALGGAVFGRLADRMHRPALAYGV